MLPLRSQSAGRAEKPRLRQRLQAAVQPFPIVPEHFTLVHEQHRPQRIGDSVGDMLDLARFLASRYIVFYNGPQCGASAPDHLHFQAGRKAELPADLEYDRLKQPTPSSNSI